MIIEGSIVNPAQIVYVTRTEDKVYATMTSIISLSLETSQVESEVLEFADPDGDVFAVLAKEIERLSPPRPV